MVSCLDDFTVTSTFSLSLALTGVALNATVTGYSSWAGFNDFLVSPERLNSANFVSYFGGARACRPTTELFTFVKSGIFLALN